MRRTLKVTGRRNEDGSIAVEAALVLPILVLFLGLPSIVLAFYYRQYSAAQKAAHDAAIYLSTAPRLEFTTPGLDTNFVANTVAKKIVAKELEGIVPKDVSVSPYITCQFRVGNTLKGRECTPQNFNSDTSPLVRFDVEVSLPFINPLTGNEITSMSMAPIPSAYYLGN
jgi:Flp pilus assembly protein TadG